MASVGKKYKWWWAMLVLIPLVIFGGSAVLGVVINPTPSVPVGLYIKKRKPLSQLRRQDYILFCPDHIPLFDIARSRGYFMQGSCPSGVAPLLKQVAALSGDVVTVDVTGIRVNGVYWQNSRILLIDLDGTPLPTILDNEFVISRDMVLPLSNYSPNSFDGRYFGPIYKSDILAVVQPVFTW